MGSSQSVFTSLPRDKGGLKFPIPAHVFHAITSKKRKHDDRYLEAFTSFVNSAARMEMVIKWGSWGFQQVVAHVLRIFYSAPEFRAFWDSRDGYDPRLLHFRFEDSAIKESGDVHTLREGIKHAITTNNDFFMVATLTISTAGNKTMHANMCVFKYTRRTRQLSCRLFEPHARACDVVNKRVEAFRVLLNGIVSSVFREMGVIEWGKWLLGFKQIEIRSSYPSSKAGLQTNSPICVQWSLIMFLVYMLNCEVAGVECGEEGYKSALDILWEKRKDLVPAWLFFMELVSGSDIPAKASWKFLMNPTIPETVTVPPMVYNPKKARMFNSALDYAKCSDKSEQECKHPCQFARGHCFNPALFSPPR
jgi:hypothetical protein